MEKGNQILKQYISKSKFYSGLKIDEDYFEKSCVETPILTKKDIQSKYLDILNSDYHNLDINALKVARTSGSTGQPLEVFWSSDEMMRSNLCLWRLRKKYYNIFPNSICASFHSILYNKSMPMDTEQIEIYNNGVNISFSKFFLEESDMELYLHEMEAFGVEWLLIQPSIAQKLYDYLNAKGTKLPPKIKYIELNGKKIDPFCLTYCVENVNSRFGNPIKQFKVVLSNNELGLILEIYSKYRLWEESISTEIIKICKKALRMNVPIKVEFASQELSLNHDGKFRILERR